MNPDYSNREIDTLVKELKEQLDRIEVQTTKTNGRVSTLENWRAGIIAVLAFIAFALPLVWLLVKELLK